MKKIFTKISLLCIGLMLCAGNAWAESEPIGETGLYWELTSPGMNSNEVLTITGSGALPDYEEYFDTPWSLYIVMGVKTLNLPDGLTRIGNNVFNSGYISITSITIPSSVTSIGANALNNSASFTGSLQSVTIERTTSVVTLDNVNAFPEGIEHIYVPADLVDAYKAAANWSALADKISEPAPESPYVGEQFIDNGVKYEITNIQEYGVTKLVYAKVVPYTINYYGADFSMYYGDIVIPQAVVHADVVIPIIAIGDEAFKNSSSLTSVSLSTNIQIIGTDAFANCTSIESMTIPSSVTSIGEYAFTGMSITPTIAAGDITIDDGEGAAGVIALLNDSRNITLNRPAQMEHYNTICLPFALDADQIAESSLADAEIYKFSNAEKEGDYLDLHFQPVTAMEAGVPYFFRFPTSGDNLGSLTFEGVTVTTTTPQDVVHGDVTLHGTLSQVTINGSGKLYLTAGNNLMYYNGDKTINPFRAYFEVAGLAPNNAPKARIVAHENATTGVEDVAAEVEAVKFVENGQILIKRGEAVYNLQGQVVK